MGKMRALFKKIRDTEGTFHIYIGSPKLWMEVSLEFTCKSLWNVEIFSHSNSVTHGIQVPGKPTVASLTHDVEFQQISHPTPWVVLGPALELRMNAWNPWNLGTLQTPVPEPWVLRRIRLETGWGVCAWGPSARSQGSQSKSPIQIWLGKLLGGSGKMSMTSLAYDRYFKLHNGKESPILSSYLSMLFLFSWKNRFWNLPFLLG